MDFNKRIKIGKFQNVQTNQVFYYPIVKKCGKNAWLVAIWYGNNTRDLTVDTFVIGTKEYQLLEVYNHG